MSQFALYLLGPPRIEIDGKPVTLQRRKAMALIAYLAVTGETQSREKLATLLWPDYDVVRVRNNLRVVLAAIKKGLGDTQWITLGQGDVGLNRAAGWWIDVAYFRDLLTRWQTHDHPLDAPCTACLNWLTEAVALYRDDFLAGFTLPDCPGFDEWQFFEAENLRQAFAGALEKLVHDHQARGEFEPAMVHARRWVALDPLHEPAHRHLMMLYAQTGQRAAALRQYATCSRLLGEELGIEPVPETTVLYQQILSQKIDIPSPHSAPLHSPSALPPFLAEEEPSVVERNVFVARERELTQLNAFLDAAMAPPSSPLTGEHRGVIFVTGEIGTGKTALIQEFAQRAQDRHPGPDPLHPPSRGDQRGSKGRPSSSLAAIAVPTRESATRTCRFAKS